MTAPFTVTVEVNPASDTECWKPGQPCEHHMSANGDFCKLFLKKLKTSKDGKRQLRCSACIQAEKEAKN